MKLYYKHYKIFNTYHGAMNIDSAINGSSLCIGNKVSDNLNSKSARIRRHAQADCDFALSNFVLIPKIIRTRRD